MITPAKVRTIALSFPNTEELPHFELTSFRVKGKIFATMDEKINRVCLMFNTIDQSVFCAFDKTIIYPVPNKWGQKGATYVELKKVRVDMFKDMMKQAYNGKLKNK